MINVWSLSFIDESRSECCDWLVIFFWQSMKDESSEGELALDDTKVATVDEMRKYDEMSHNSITWQHRHECIFTTYKATAFTL